jgi:adenylate cyclase class IV
MVLAVCVLHYLHWSTRISEARANAQLETQRSRAELLTESVRLKDQAELEKQRLEHFRERMLLEQDYVAAIGQFAQIKQQGQRALAAITDPETKRELMALMGRVVEEPQPKRISPLPAAATTTTDDGSPKS